MVDRMRLAQVKFSVDELDISYTKTYDEMFSYTEVNSIMTETSAATIDRILSRHEIGAKLRKLRLRKKVSLSDLGKHTGFSASLISQLENGRMIPTLPTLVRIATVFNTGLEHFFGSERGEKLFSIMRGSERMKFPERPGTPTPALLILIAAKPMNNASVVTTSK